MTFPAQIKCKECEKEVPFQDSCIIWSERTIASFYCPECFKLFPVCKSRQKVIQNE